jgi:hypothetical protein
MPPPLVIYTPAVGPEYGELVIRIFYVYVHNSDIHLQKTFRYTSRLTQELLSHHLTSSLGWIQ